MVMFALIVGIFAWAIYLGESAGLWKAAGFVVLSVPVGYWLIGLICKTCRRYGSFSDK